MALGVAGTNPAYGHGLRVLWYQARVAPFTVDTRPLYPHSSRAPPGFTCCSSFAEGVATWPTPRSERGGGGSFSARLSRGLPPAWGLGTRALRTVRGHSTQSNLTPYPKAAPNASLGDLELVCLLPLRSVALATAFMFLCRCEAVNPTLNQACRTRAVSRLNQACRTRAVNGWVTLNQACRSRAVNGWLARTGFVRSVVVNCR